MLSILFHCTTTVSIGRPSTSRIQQLRWVRHGGCSALSSVVLPQRRKPPYPDAMNLEIESNTRVTLNFSLSLETGEEVDTNFGADPVSFVMGDGSLLPGFERRLIGMRAGDEAEFRIPPEEGFGEPQDDNVQFIPRTDFDEDAPLEPGMLFTFADAAGGEVPGMIAEVGDERVTVDFNHPLSGRTIHFKVRIAHVEPAELH